MTSKNKTDEFESFDDSRNRLINTVWNFIPKRLRLPIVAIILIVTAGVSTQSYWMSWFFDKTPPERLIVRGKILNHEIPIALSIKLITDKQTYTGRSDETGFVVFNIEKEENVKSIRFQIREEWKEIYVEQDGLLPSGKFSIEINEPRLICHE